MDDERRADLLGERDVPPEGLLLRRHALGPGAEVVEAGLADPEHLRPARRSASARSGPGPPPAPAGRPPGARPGPSRLQPSPSPSTSRGASFGCSATVAWIVRRNRRGLLAAQRGGPATSHPTWTNMVTLTEAATWRSDSPVVRPCMSRCVCESATGAGQRLRHRWRAVIGRLPPCCALDEVSPMGPESKGTSACAAQPSARSSSRGKSTAPFVTTEPAGSWPQRPASCTGCVGQYGPSNAPRRPSDSHSADRGLRHHRVEQHRHGPQRLGGGVQDRGPAAPGLAADSFLATFHGSCSVRYPLTSLMKSKIALRPPWKSSASPIRSSAVADGLRPAPRPRSPARPGRGRSPPAARPHAVLADHGGHPGGQVAVVVGQFRGVPGGHVLPGERAVLAERNRAHEVVAERVRAEVVGDLRGGDAGQLRLGHLLAADQQPAVAEHLARQRKPGRHQHRRPDHRVEAQDVLADQVHRPAGPWRTARTAPAGPAPSSPTAVA